MISCADAVRQLLEYLDGTVDQAERTLADAAHDDLPDDVLRRLNRVLEELEP